MISTFGAVFDSNVLYGLHLRSLLMELAMSGLFRPYWSADIHREWMEAVSKKAGIAIGPEASSAKSANDQPSLGGGCMNSIVVPSGSRT